MTQVEVRQGDVDAAKPFLDRFLDGSSFSDDTAELTQAFARHAAQAREEGARLALEAAAKACLDCPPGPLNNRGSGAIAIRALSPADIVKGG